jgi:hypothetical protein
MRIIDSRERIEVQSLRDLGFEEARVRMCEPEFSGLLRKQPAIEAYRIVCLPTFERPYLLRWQRTVESMVAVYKETDGLGGYDLGYLCREVPCPLSPDQWRRILAHVDRLDFWNSPRRTRESGLDGESWVMEAIRGSDYRVISRWGGGTIQAILRHVLEVIPEIDRAGPHRRAG